MNTPILYSFRRCPYAMRARLALYASGITVELREIILRDKPAHMLEISPKGTVPVLLLPGGKIIDESLDIMLWALGQSDPENLMKGDKTETNFLIARNDKEFKYALDRYKYPEKFPDTDSEQNFENAKLILDDLDKRLENGALLGQETTLADLAILPFIRQFAHVDRERFDALPYKNLQSWVKDFKESERFAHIMPKFKPWQEGDEPIYFGRDYS